MWTARAVQERSRADFGLDAPAQFGSRVRNRLVRSEEGEGEEGEGEGEEGLASGALGGRR